MTRHQIEKEEAARGRSELLSPRAAAEHLGGRPSQSTLAKMRMRGDGPPFVKLGARLVAYYADDLDHWAAGRRRCSTSQV